MGASLVAQLVKNLPVMQETWVPFLSREDALEKEIEPTQYSFLENPMDRGAWQAAVHGGSQESDLTDQLNHRHQTFPLLLCLFW